MSIAYVAIGANLGDPLAQAQSAISALTNTESTRVIAISSWYRSKAIGPQQPDYLNGVVCIETSLQPTTLLTALQQIETDHSRQRLERWGPRTLDLDLLLFNDVVLDKPDLSLPHPQMTARNFVLVPLLEISPELRLPDGRRLADIAHTLGQDGLAPWHQNQ